MALNWERERLDNLIFLFNNQSLSMSKDSSNNILPLEFPSDEVGSTVDLNFTLRINFSDKRNFSFCNGEIEMTIGIHIFIQVKSLWQVSEGFPEVVSEHTGESCTLFFLGKTSMWFLIMVIPQKPLTRSFKDRKVGASMSSKHSFLPEAIKTLNRGVSPGFSLWDKYQMDPHKQVETYELRDAIAIASSTRSSHLIIHLRYLGNPHKSPCFNKMPAQREGLLIRELTCKGRMTRHIHSMEGIESGNPFWTSEISGSHKVCLMEVSHLFSGNIRIRLIVTISFGFSSPCLSITRENLSNGRDSGDISNLPLLELPVDNLSPNAREGRTSTLVGFQLRSNGENLFNRTLRSFPPDSLWSTTLIFETIKPMLFISSEPFRKPESTSLNQMEYLFKFNSFFMKLYCLTAFFIFLLILHRLSLPKTFWKKFRRC
jgi:hypothetical protein